MWRYTFTYLLAKLRPGPPTIRLLRENSRNNQWRHLYYVPRYVYVHVILTARRIWLTLCYLNSLPHILRHVCVCVWGGGGSGSWGLCDIHSYVRTFVLCHAHHYFKRLQQCNAANMQGKVIDSRYFTQANICIDYTKFLRLLNAMPVRFLYFMHPYMYSLGTRPYVRIWHGSGGVP